MYTEFACYDERSEKEVKKQVFEALEAGANGISVPSIFLSQIAEIMPAGITLSCPIDHPNGIEETKAREHLTIRAIHKGANSIDLVANMTHLVNDSPEDFILDLSTIKSICENNDVVLRVMLDYRVVDQALFKEACVILETLEIKYAFASTGFFVDACQENVILSHVMKKNHGLDVIANGNIYLKKHRKMVENADIFGIRYHKIHAVKNCSVYNKAD